MIPGPSSVSTCSSLGPAPSSVGSSRSKSPGRRQGCPFVVFEMHTDPPEFDESRSSFVLLVMTMRKSRHDLLGTLLRERPLANDIHNKKQTKSQPSIACRTLRSVRRLGFSAACLSAGRPAQQASPTGERQREEWVARGYWLLPARGSGRRRN
ncbi:uncharacterized protein BKA78DRAFT_192331 [Phyllosticta capitalensis]|uniref:uncharacterized protein n=1 Tax=Phyllosticta capitalensis TaxID=121624 RepID=UPI00312DD220